MSNVTRNTDWNLREFDREKWPAVATLIAEACTMETTPRLSRVVSYVARREGGRKPESLLGQDIGIAGASARVPQGLALGAYQSLITETVIAACTADDEAIIELGSGWSRNLFIAWLSGAPFSAEYVGAELTAAGRAAAARLAALEPALRYRAIPFNYEQPDLSEIAGYEKSLVFSVHSADYVRDLKPHVIDEIRSVARSVTCIHFENFGWQATGDSPQSSPAAEYAYANDYNRNLFSLLHEEARAGRIELQAVELNAIGLHPRYVTSVAVWRSAQ